MMKSPRNRPRDLAGERFDPCGDLGFAKKNAYAAYLRLPFQAPWLWTAAFLCYHLSGLQRDVKTGRGRL